MIPQFPLSVNRDDRLVRRELVGSRGLPGWALPVAGGAVFTALVGIWLTSSLWYFTVVKFPGF